MRQAYAPVSEIRKGDDTMLTYPKHVVQDFQRLSSLLQRLAKDHIVEGAIRKIGQRFLQIAMKNGHAARASLLRFRSGNLDPARIHALMHRQPPQQFSFSTAEVEDTRIRLDELADDGVSAASPQLRNKGLRHAIFLSLVSSCGAGNPALSRLPAV